MWYARNLIQVFYSPESASNESSSSGYSTDDIEKKPAIAGIIIKDTKSISDFSEGRSGVEIKKEKDSQIESCVEGEISLESLKRTDEIQNGETDKANIADSNTMGSRPDSHVSSNVMDNSSQSTIQNEQANQSEAQSSHPTQPQPSVSPARPVSSSSQDTRERLVIECEDTEDALKLREYAFDWVDRNENKCQGCGDKFPSGLAVLQHVLQVCTLAGKGPSC